MRENPLYGAFAKRPDGSGGQDSFFLLTHRTKTPVLPGNQLDDPLSLKNACPGASIALAVMATQADRYVSDPKKANAKRMEAV